MSYAPTKEQREVVKTMAGYGIPAEEITKVIKNSQTHQCLPMKEFLEVFVDELSTGEVLAYSNVMQTLYNRATGKDKDSITAAKTWVEINGINRNRKSVHERIKEAIQLSERAMSKDFE